MFADVESSNGESCTVATNFPPKYCKEFTRYLHRKGIPLREVDFEELLKKQKPKDEQLDLFNNECEGMCGV